MKIILPLILLLMLPLIPAISLNNTLDFADNVFELSNCSDSLNFTELVSGGILQNPEKLMTYQKSPTCENLIEGSALYLKLAYPSATCPKDFDNRIHDWITSGYSNWAFKNCGVNFTKANWDNLVVTYFEGFYLGELEIPKPPEEIYFVDVNQTYQPESITPQQKPLFGGGSPDVGKNSMWDTWLFLANWQWIEIILLIISYKIGGLFWRQNAYKEAEGWFAPKNPTRNLGISISKKLKLLLIVFIILNAILWIAFYTL